MYLVTGATGKLGQRIVRHLRNLGHPVRAFVRLQSNYERLKHWGASICLGDLAYAEDIQRACQDVEVVISAHGSATSQATLASIEQVDFRANLRLIQAAEASSVQHFVFISLLGAHQLQKEALLFRAKAQIEQILQASKLKYTILRPSGLASNILRLTEWVARTGIYPLLGDGRRRISIISNDDLAQLACLAPGLPTAQNQIFNVGGPQILRRDQIPTIVGRLLKRDLMTLTIPLELFDLSRWLSPNAEFEQTLDTLRSLLAHEYFCSSDDIHQLQTTFGINLESLEQYLRRHLDLE